VIARTWIAAHRLRRRLSGPPPDREALVREHAPGRSFLDVGCMWSVSGRIAFAAEEAGAAQVTGIDVMGRTEAFDAEHARRDSAVRFVQGDLHDPATMAEAGRHDVVWCSGVLYHAPHPLLTLERLRSVCGERLILSTEALPEIPGLRGGCVFYPGLDDRARRAYAGVPGGRAVGLTEPFDAAEGYGNWYWGITPSALRGMLRATGFEEERWVRSPFHLAVVARAA
jgi:hypothetical protein